MVWHGATAVCVGALPLDCARDTTTGVAEPTQPSLGQMVTEAEHAEPLRHDDEVAVQ